jgi:hypothetical protein
MRFRQIRCLLVALLVLGSVSSPATASSVIRLQFNSNPIGAGDTGTLTVHFRVAEGFKVPKRPTSRFQLNSSAEVEIKGDFTLMEEGKGKDSEYFNALKPLSIQLSPSRTARRGQHLLEGKFTYFYCSEKEKFCSRSVETLQIPVEVIDLK